MPTKRRASTGGVEVPSQKPRVDDGKHDETTNGSTEQDSLSQLSKLSTIVADTADFESIKAYNPTDATTNPTLVLQAAKLPQYKAIVRDAIEEAKEENKGQPRDIVIEDAVDRILVGFGVELLKIIPGLVSTEISADLSFDTKASVERARKLIRLYEQKGISKSKVLIKIAATWEGIQAAKELAKEGINCNITLLFSLVQAAAAAEAGAFLISPFVGRILDWYKKNHPEESYEGDADPGVKSVKEIYNYYKHFGFNTVVMAASFRNTSEIIHLAGCDRLTISPKLLGELKLSNEDISACLSPSNAKDLKIKKVDVDEKSFRWELNQNAMATEKLAEGIRNFSSDLHKLKRMIEEQL